MSCLNMTNRDFVCFDYINNDFNNYLYPVKRVAFCCFGK